MRERDSAPHIQRLRRMVTALDNLIALADQGVFVRSRRWSCPGLRDISLVKGLPPVNAADYRAALDALGIERQRPDGTSSIMGVHSSVLSQAAVDSAPQLAFQLQNAVRAANRQVASREESEFDLDKFNAAMKEARVSNTAGVDFRRRR